MRRWRRALAQRQRHTWGTLLCARAVSRTGRITGQEARWVKSYTSEMSVRPPDPRLLGFLAAYDPHIAELALALREMLLEAAPDAIEAIYDAYNAVAIGFSFTGRLKDTFCHVATYAHHVNLGFNRGATLADPHKVLQGTGKSVRHIKVARIGDLAAPDVARYIHEAITQIGGMPDKMPGEVKSVVRGNYPNKRRPLRSK
jgi:hypothetical protein